MIRGLALAVVLAALVLGWLWAGHAAGLSPRTIRLGHAAIGLVVAIFLLSRAWQWLAGRWRRWKTERELNGRLAVKERAAGYDGLSRKVLERAAGGSVWLVVGDGAAIERSARRAGLTVALHRGAETTWPGEVRVWYQAGRVALVETPAAAVDAEGLRVFAREASKTRPAGVLLGLDGTSEALDVEAKARALGNEVATVLRALLAPLPPALPMMVVVDALGEVPGFRAYSEHAVHGPECLGFAVEPPSGAEVGPQTAALDASFEAFLRRVECNLGDALGPADESRGGLLTLTPSLRRRLRFLPHLLLGPTGARADEGKERGLRLTYVPAVVLESGEGARSMSLLGLPTLLGDWGGGRPLPSPTISHGSRRHLRAIAAAVACVGCAASVWLASAGGAALEELERDRVAVQEAQAEGAPSEAFDALAMRLTRDEPTHDPIVDVYGVDDRGRWLSQVHARLFTAGFVPPVVQRDTRELDSFCDGIGELEAAHASLRSVSLVTATEEEDDAPTMGQEDEELLRARLLGAMPASERAGAHTELYLEWLKTLPSAARARSLPAAPRRLQSYREAVGEVWNPGQAVTHIESAVSPAPVPVPPPGVEELDAAASALVLGDLPHRAYGREAYESVVDRMLRDYGLERSRAVGGEAAESEQAARDEYASRNARHWVRFLGDTQVSCAVQAEGVTSRGAAEQLLRWVARQNGWTSPTDPDTSDEPPDESAWRSLVSRLERAFAVVYGDGETVDEVEVQRVPRSPAPELSGLFALLEDPRLRRYSEELEALASDNTPRSRDAVAELVEELTTVHLHAGPPGLQASVGQLLLDPLGCLECYPEDSTRRWQAQWSSAHQRLMRTFPRRPSRAAEGLRLDQFDLLFGPSSPWRELPTGLPAGRWNRLAAAADWVEQNYYGSPDATSPRLDLAMRLQARDPEAVAVLRVSGTEIRSDAAAPTDVSWVLEEELGGRVSLRVGEEELELGAGPWGLLRALQRFGDKTAGTGARHPHVFQGELLGQPLRLEVTTGRRDPLFGPGARGRPRFLGPLRRIPWEPARCECHYCRPPRERHAGR